MAVTGHELHPTEATRELARQKYYDYYDDFGEDDDFDKSYRSMSNPTRSGDRAGRKRLRSEWRAMGSDCSNAFQIRKIAKRLIKKLCKRRSGDNWKRRAYKKAAAESMKQAARSYEKQCLGGGVGGIDECEGLGDAAVDLLAQEYCGTQDDYYAMAMRRPNYRKMCVNAAVDICKGNVSSKTNGERLGELRLTLVKGLVESFMPAAES
eukprot:scaffold9511_cov182-Skeletonema_dohrnii-CCMP3373.AAC.9